MKLKGKFYLNVWTSILWFRLPLNDLWWVRLSIASMDNGIGSFLQNGLVCQTTMNDIQYLRKWILIPIQIFALVIMASSKTRLFTSLVNPLKSQSNLCFNFSILKVEYFSHGPLRHWTWYFRKASTWCYASGGEASGLEYTLCKRIKSSESPLPTMTTPWAPVPHFQIF